MQLSQCLIWNKIIVILPLFATTSSIYIFYSTLRFCTHSHAFFSQYHFPLLPVTADSWNIIGAMPWGKRGNAPLLTFAPPLSIFDQNVHHFSKLL